MASLITDLHIRVSREELADLQRMGAEQKSPVSAVVRAMIRDYLIAWRKDGLTLQLGSVTWSRKE